MSTLIITGSPRKGMFSDSIADMIKEMKGGDIVHLREKNIAPCTACEYCHRDKGNLCIRKDDMAPLYNAVKDSDTLVLLSPIYWWQVTAQMKAFIDRLYALDHEVWKGKKAVVILNGGAEDDDVEFRILHDAFKEMFDYLSVDFRYLGIGTTDEKAFEAKEAKIRSFIEENI